MNDQTTATPAATAEIAPAGGSWRVGFIGAGFIAQVAHIWAFSLDPRARLVAICDPRSRLADEVAERFRIETVAERPHELLALPLDVVVVCVHRRCLGPLVAEALASVPLVLSEKPMARTLDEGRRLLAVAEASGATWAVGLMKRHDQGVAIARRLLSERLADEAWGKIVHVAVRDFCPTYAVPIPDHIRSSEPKRYRYEEWPDAPSFLPLEQREEYDYALNVAVHDLNLVRFLLPEPLESAALFVRPGRTQTAILAAASYDVMITFGQSDAGVWDQSIEVFFERARLRLALASPLSREAAGIVTVTRSGQTVHHAIPPGERRSAFRRQAGAVLDMLEGRGALANAASESLDDLALLEGLWRRVVWQS